jgi:hypothetical protein
MASTSLLLTSVEVDQCVECGATDETVEVFRSECGTRRDADGNLFCDECRPQCHACRDCDPDYFNDLLFDN